eukprot:330698-Amphidinium_carterae.1
MNCYGYGFCSGGVGQRKGGENYYQKCGVWGSRGVPVLWTPAEVLLAQAARIDQHPTNLDQFRTPSRHPPSMICS